MPGKVEGFPKLEVCNFGSEALRPCPVGFVPGTGEFFFKGHAGPSPIVLDLGTGRSLQN